MHAVGKTIIIFSAIFICLGACINAQSASMTRGQSLLSEQELDLYCLKLSYPQIKKIHKSNFTDPVIELSDGAKLPYRQKTPRHTSPLDTDLAGAMDQIYPLEPERPDTPQGFAPGRKRPYYFLEAIYGVDKNSVQRNLASIKFLSSSLRINKNAAHAFEKARPALLSLAKEARFAPLLRSDGAFYWRKIAGETVPSAHSYGIAIDLGAKNSPYWRWSKKMPHPKQKIYPGELVEILENHGFIWGGKWHEYDLMHFEYRPELICKAKMLKALEASSMGKFPSFDISSRQKKSH